MIQNKIREEVKEAMRQRDSLKLTTLRGVLAGFTNELVAKGRKPDEELDQDGALAVIKRLVKQRKDSIEQFRKGGREDLVETEEKELEILKKYLPEEVSEEEIRRIAKQKKEEAGINDKAKSGILMGAVMSQLKNQADGKLVKEIVDSLFN